MQMFDQFFSAFRIALKNYQIYWSAASKCLTSSFPFFRMPRAKAAAKKKAEEKKDVALGVKKTAKTKKPAAKKAAKKPAAKKV